MADSVTAAPAAGKAPAKPRSTRPTVSARPVAVAAANVATIAGATMVAAGGPVLLAAAGGVGLAVAAAAAKRRSSARRASMVRTSTVRTGTRGLGGLGISGRSPGRSLLGGRPGGTGGGSGSGGLRLPRLGRSTGGGRAGGTPGSGRSAGTPTGRRASATGGFRRAGSPSDSTARTPLSAARVARARRELRRREGAGPRLLDAVRGAIEPKNGTNPTAGQAWRAARQAVTGTNPKKRGPTRRAVAGAVAGLVAAYRAYRAQRRQRTAAVAPTANARPSRTRRGVATTVPRPSGAVRTTTKRVPAQPPRQKKESTVPPRPRATPATASGGGSTSASLRTASEDFLAAAMRDAPAGMLEVVADAHAFPIVLENLAKAMKVRYDKAADQPFHSVIKELYDAVHRASLAVQKTAEDIGPLIERIHRDELDRIRNPRNNEQMWDVTANRGGA